MSVPPVPRGLPSLFDKSNANTSMPVDFVLEPGHSVKSYKPSDAETCQTSQDQGQALGNHTKTVLLPTDVTYEGLVLQVSSLFDMAPGLKLLYPENGVLGAAGHKSRGKRKYQNVRDLSSDKAAWPAAKVTNFITQPL